MKKYKGSYVGTIQKEHIGKKFVRFDGKTYMVKDFLGNVLKQDIGKQIWLTGPGVLQVESDRQRNERMEQE